jgi:hypothetical protein
VLPSIAVRKNREPCVLLLPRQLSLLERQSLLRHMHLVEKEIPLKKDASQPHLRWRHETLKLNPKPPDSSETT